MQGKNLHNGNGYKRSPTHSTDGDTPLQGLYRKKQKAIHEKPHQVQYAIFRQTDAAAASAARANVTKAAPTKPWQRKLGQAVGEAQLTPNTSWSATLDIK